LVVYNRLIIIIIIMIIIIIIITWEAGKVTIDQAYYLLTYLGVAKHHRYSGIRNFE